MKKRVTLCLTIFLLIFSSINIFSQAPVITKQPHSHGVIVGQKATFSVEASGDTLTYQWYLNDNPIGGATDSVYTTPVATLVHNGEQFYVIVSNSHGKDTSETVKLYATAAGSRVTANQVTLYNFKDRQGNTIHDIAGFSTPLNLTINNTSSTDWSNNGLFVKSGASIKSTSNVAASRVIDSLRLGNEMTLEMWVRPLTVQNARIIDLTVSPTNIDFLAESIPPTGYNFNVRTTTTDNLARPGCLKQMGLMKI